MKKLLLVFAIAAFVASCNDSGNTEETPAADTPKVEVAPPPPTTVDTSGSDTTKVDTLKK